MRSCTPPSLSLATIQRGRPASPPLERTLCIDSPSDGASPPPPCPLAVQRLRKKRYTPSKPPCPWASRASNTARRGARRQRPQIHSHRIAEFILAAFETRRHSLVAVNDHLPLVEFLIGFALGEQRRIETGEIAVDDVHEVRRPADHVQQAGHLDRQI